MSISLNILLQDWCERLRAWSADGSLASAARLALELQVDPPLLTELVSQWTEGDFSALPPIVLLPASSMPGAAGAYAISTGTIYLNEDWLETASDERVIALLTEEWGHHLDALLNPSDTTGDEGGLISRLLLSADLSADQHQAISHEYDQIQILVDGEWIAAEASGFPSPSTPDLIAASDSGNSDTDNLTNDSTPTVTGTAKANSSVELFSGGASLGSTTADGSGNWSFTVPGGSELADGSYTITATTLQSKPIPPASPGRTTQEWRNNGAFAALKIDGSVITWGSYYGGDSSAVSSKLSSGVSQLFSTGSAFAALKDDGSVITWGSPYDGGDSSAVSSQLSSGVSQLFSTSYAFAALKDDGSVVSWGDSENGGNSSAVSSQLSSGVSQLFSTEKAFAALKDDGSVVSWGDSSYGGYSSSLDFDGPNNNLKVTQIFSTRYAFAALKDDGSVITWGSPTFGGNSSAVSSQLSSGVSQLFSTSYAFAALKEDGSVITWGRSGSGGDSNWVDFDGPNNDLMVTQIFSTDSAFAALRSDGSVITWGRSGSGGDSSSVDFDGPNNDLKVTQIFSTSDAFAALKDDGSVVSWGDSENGGNSSAVSSQLSSGVSQLFSTPTAFAALKDDGSVITWGRSGSGGDSNWVDFDGPNNDLKVTQIFSTSDAFAALRSDGSVVSWGDSYFGGDDSAVSSQLTSGVVSFADPFQDDRLVFGGSGSGLTSDPSPALTLTVDTTAPIFTSGSTAAAIDEYSGAAQVVYTAISDTTSVTYSLKTCNNDDPAAFSIDSTSGEVTLNVDPDYETQSAYTFTVIATDAAGNSSEQAVALAINDLDDTPPDAPSTPDLIAASDSGNSDTDNLTNNPTPTFTGTAEANRTVELFSGGASLGSTTTDGTGNWSFTVPGGSELADGSHTITTTTLQSKPIPPASPGRTTQEWRNNGAFAALKIDGSVITWGSPTYGGDSSAVSSKLSSGVSQLFSTSYAFAALKDDGSVITWGDSWFGGNSSAVSSQLSSGVYKLFSTGYTFAALKEDGSVITWGGSSTGGDSNWVDFDGLNYYLTVTQIFSNSNAFAALLSDGSVITWGSFGYGGDSSSVDFDGPNNNLKVTQIFSTDSAFAALRSDGSVITWGNFPHGADSSSVDFDGPNNNLKVTQIFSTGSAFAALRCDGSVITWGDSSYGGDSSAVSSQLSSRVSQLFSTERAFAALKDDGSVITWGDFIYGGNSSSVDFDGPNDNLKVTQIFSTDSAFAALRSDGSVITWGDSENGGNSSSVDFDGPNNDLKVTQIFSTGYAFAALRSDGSVITWGDFIYGGNSSSVDFDGPNDNLKVTQIFSTDSAFAALRSDGSVITWGSPTSGGDSSAVSSKLTSGVVSFADPFQDDRLVFGGSGSGLTSEPSPALTLTIDTSAPTFISADTAEAIDENSGAAQVVYTAVSYTTSVTYSLKPGNNDDAAAFSIDSTSGDVTLSVDPDYESQPSYGFTVVATDAAGNSSEQAVALAINDLDDTPPAAPSTPDLIAASDSGNSDTDNLTSDTTPSFTGTAEADSVVELFSDGASLGRTRADGSGNWSFTVPASAPLSDGPASITATAIDGDGAGPSSPVLYKHPIPPASPGRTTQEWRNHSAFAALKDDGSVITWGSPTSGGNSSAVSSQLTSGVSQLFSTGFGFAALKEGGSVITWGGSYYGGYNSSVDFVIYGGIDFDGPNNNLKVTQIFSTGSAFAALRSDGSVITWGPSSGGDSSSVDFDGPNNNLKVTQIFSTGSAFAALRSDGSVITWGDSSYGGNSSAVSSQLTSGVSQLFSTERAFAALKDDGSVITWGDSWFGGNSSSVDFDGPNNNLKVTQIFSTEKAFAALRSDGSVITWGDYYYGGNSSGVDFSGVSQLFSTERAFAALKEDGSVITWGGLDPSSGATRSSYGGDSSGVDFDGPNNNLKVTQIFSTNAAFAALRSDGSVITWGESSYGGDSSVVDFDGPNNNLKVTQIFSTSFAFAALRSDGSVITWGSPTSGGDSSSVDFDGPNNNLKVTQIFSTSFAFAALRSDGSVITWGSPTSGGNSSAVSSQLTSGVVSFADPFQDDYLVFPVPLESVSGLTSDPSPALTLTVDTTAPIFTSGSTAAPIDENSGAAQVVYTATTSDTTSVTYSLKTGNNDDATSFSIDSTSGEVTLSADPDYESQPSYGFTVVAIDAAGNSSEQAVALAINDLDDTRPDAPSTPDLIAASDSGNSDTDNLTNNPTPTFTGTAEANSSVELFSGGASLGRTRADGSGNWSFTVPGGSELADGSYTITATTLQSKPIPPASPGRTTQEWRNNGAFAALKDDGSVITWGDSSYGGNSSAVSSQLTSGVSQLFSTERAFAALKDDGSVITWGDSWFGGNSSSVDFDGPNNNLKVTQIFSTGSAFAALKDDGSVITWGDSWFGGNSSSVDFDGPNDNLKVTQIFSTDSAFAALRSDGSVITWGDSSSGGDSSGVDFDGPNNNLKVTQIFSTGSAFAALKHDGSVITWGDSYYGGTSSGVDFDGPNNNLKVTQIFSTRFAFAALKDDGSVITWGSPYYGGNSSAVSSQLSSGVSQLFSTERAFAALKDDGSVITWGDFIYGGNSSSVDFDGPNDNLKVTQIFSTDSAFAALRSDGSVITWGDSENGGNSSSVDFDGPNNDLKVTQIFSTGYAFAALRSDGSVITWGDFIYGGNSSSVDFDGPNDNLKVTQIFSTDSAFAALRSDGSVITWGSPTSGGDSSAVSSKLTSGVVSFADPFQDDRLVFGGYGAGLTSEPSPALTLTIDTSAPTFISAATAEAIDENSGAAKVVYTATTSDTTSVTYSLKTGNNDHATSFSINATTGDVTLLIDPDYETQSSYAFSVVATDAAGNSSEQAVALEVNDRPEGPVLSLNRNGSSIAAPLSAYDPAQDLIGSASLSDQNTTLTLSGNTWKKVDIGSYEITGKTILSFSFSKSSEGEIHGIGFDNDNKINNSSNNAFQLSGSQSWGLQDFNTYTAGSDPQSFEIPVGESFSGTFQYLTFINDDDAANTPNPLATGTFSNIRLFEDSTAPLFSSAATAEAIDENSGAAKVVYTATTSDTTSVTYSLKTGNNDHATSFSINATTGDVTLLIDPDYETQSSYAFSVVATDAAGNSSEQAVALEVNDRPEGPVLSLNRNGSSIAAPLSAYDPAQDLIGSASLSDQNTTLTLSGNTWKKVDIGSYEITGKTILSFSFSKSSEGEIHGIGFDNDNKINNSSNNAFQLSGSQSWGLQDFNTYTAGSDPQSFEIPVGESFSGTFQYLTFINDDDAANTPNPLATGTFSNIRLFEDSTAPLFSSAATAEAIDENSGAAKVVYTATTSDTTSVTYSLKTGNNDHATSFSINATTGDVTLLIDPDYETQSSYAFSVVATDAAGNSSEQAVALEVNDRPEGPVLSLNRNGSSIAAPLSAYDPAQDLIGSASLSDQNTTLTLSGNTWKKVDIGSYEITGKTILSFSFSKSSEGEIHGIGFDNDNKINNSSNNAFQLSGSQSWGLQDFNTYTAGSDPQSFEIPVGESFSGTFQYLTFINDDDAANTPNPLATGTFSNIRLFEDSTAPLFSSAATAEAIDENSGAAKVVYTATTSDTTSVTYSLKTGNNDHATSFSINATTGDVTLLIDPDYETQSSYAFSVVATDAAGNSSEQAVALEVNDRPEGPVLSLNRNGSSIAAPLSAYDPAQDLIGSASLSDQNTTLTLSGNTWKKVDIGSYEITGKTILSFSFDSSVEGEIQGIGFDNDDIISPDKTFQLSGSQTWGLQDFNTYTAGSDPQSFEIPVGESFSGTFQYLTFINDDDAANTPNPLATGTFSNIRLFENFL